MNLRKLLKPLAAILVIIYLIISYYLLLAPNDVAIMFLRIYVWLLTTAFLALGAWVSIKLFTVPRPVPLPEVERQFEEELKRLYEEWRGKE